jgi:hypothetical protein
MKKSEEKLLRDSFEKALNLIKMKGDDVARIENPERSAVIIAFGSPQTSEVCACVDRWFDAQEAKRRNNA